MEHPEWLARAGLLKAATGLSSKNHELALETTERILEHPFIAPVPDESGLTNDGWPVRLARRVELFTDHGLQRFGDSLVHRRVPGLPEQRSQAHER